MSIRKDDLTTIDAAREAWVAAWEMSWAAANNAWYEEKLKSGDKIIRASGRAAWTAAMVASRTPAPPAALKSAGSTLAWTAAWEKAIAAAKVSFAARHDAERILGKEDISIEIRMARGKEAGEAVWIAARERVERGRP